MILVLLFYFRKTTTLDPPPSRGMTTLNERYDTVWKAGIQVLNRILKKVTTRIPGFAGMTNVKGFMEHYTRVGKPGRFEPDVHAVRKFSVFIFQ